MCLCVCMSVLCLRGGCIFCVTFPALAFSCLFMNQLQYTVVFSVLNHFYGNISLSADPDQKAPTGAL